jgi:hypothetical protein
VGYVSTNYCKRPISEVLKDVKSYGAWSEDEKWPGLGVEGIFFDETPNVYSEESKTYLDAITKAVKDNTGILGHKLVSMPTLRPSSYNNA